ncbi:MAG: hypothetical protein HC902_10420 [Calothrix sp. SM1_5_4]|nr:hypothetical protein [Calothrix sp. SM1_5_4]
MNCIEEFAADLADAAPLTTVDRILERCTWKFLLNQEYRRPLSEFGSESVRLQNEIRRLFPDQDQAPVLAHLDFLEKELDRDQEAPSPSLTAYSREDVVDITGLRREQNRRAEDRRQAEIKMKLIRSLKSRLMESQ